MGAMGILFGMGCEPTKLRSSCLYRGYTSTPLYTCFLVTCRCPETHLWSPNSARRVLVLILSACGTSVGTILAPCAKSPASARVDSGAPRPPWSRRHWAHRGTPPRESAGSPLNEISGQQPHRSTRSHGSFKQTDPDVARPLMDEWSDRSARWLSSQLKTLHRG